MIREEYLNRLVEEAYVDLYLAGNDGARIHWPWRMARENGSLGHRHSDACEHYWVDSSIGNADYGNQEVLDDALEYEAEGVLLADTEGDFDETVDAVLDGLELADDHPFEGNIIIPLQAPFDECYAEFAGQSDYYAIGGLRKASDQERIEAARTVRELAGYDIHLHGLGWGPRDELAGAIHADPDLLDSMDYSSPIQSNTGADAGDERMSVVAAKAAARLVEDLRKLTPNVTLPYAGQTGVDQFA